MNKAIQDLIPLMVHINLGLFFKGDLKKRISAGLLCCIVLLRKIIFLKP